MKEKEKLENVNCPTCKNKMKKGYMYSIRPIKWTEKSDDETIYNETTYNNGKWWSWSTTIKKIVAYKCEDCKIITFKYD